MGEKIYIYVSKEAIKKGIPNCSGACPVALAMRHAGLRHVRVDASTMSGVYHGVRFLSKRTPKAARLFIEAFDSVTAPTRMAPIRFAFTI